MRFHDSIATLNRVLATLYRSLPMYLSTSASPFARAADHKAVETLDHIVADQKDLCRRVGEFILDRNGVIELGEYPMDFTDTHFLSIEFLVHRLIEQQAQDIVDLEECVAWLANDRDARDLAEEALGSAKAHFESLEELANAPAAA